MFGIDCGTEDDGLWRRGVRRLRAAIPSVMQGNGSDSTHKVKFAAGSVERVFRELCAEMERWEPEVVAIEEVFYSVNAKSALKLGQVRGVAILAAACQGLPIAEYAPLKIKSSVVAGYGLAKKEQVQFMVARLLELKEIPEPADAADALAIAIFHLHTAQTLQLQGVGR